MRDILFKAKRIDNGEWVEGGIVERDGKAYIVGISKRLRIDGIEVDANTICQYTGLYDSTKFEELSEVEQREFLDKGNMSFDWKGNKIWENDVVKTYNSQGQECHIEQIIWADYGLNDGWCSKGIKSLIKYDKRVFDTGFGKSDARKCEVIGNIFDNPELLERQV